MGGLQPNLERYQRAAFDQHSHQSILDLWQAWVDNTLLAAFGIGIWLSAQGSRSLRVVGALMLLPVATTPLLMIFGEASLAAHIALLLVGILPGSGR